ncbi:MAG TPA: ComF family protein [Candidatus Hydrogenedentes bacterium]|nr:ComF family protein [Candidatus Hydrogenedentota bacterium]HOL77170.1 ComF family protein [Candidatus Hydrogenedentota bacterium]HPO85891.1 ComF family protein [Candidatus Hydrogenedentota bacterium]
MLTTLFNRKRLLPFLNVFFPHFCRLCKQRILTEENAFFCPECWELSPRIERPFCPVCGKPHPRGVAMMNPTLFPCGPCATTKDRFPFRRAISSAHFTGAIAEGIKLLKFQGKKRLAKPLAALLTKTIQSELDPNEYNAIVPVPLYPVRLRERGFNQSLLLAEEIKALFPNAVLDLSLKRIRPTRTQSLITDRKERTRNVRGAFAVLGEACQLKNAGVLLIDDVITSYGTVSECTRALRRAGVGFVDVLSVAMGTPV